ncbi:hypothetical protein B5V46_17640 [Rhodovulum sp. MB263]|nr:hypothetical protein B5V46_17640 [Rhodovulum sp. MB263]
MSVRRDHHRFSKKVTRTKRWQALRAEILERDRYRCRSCGCGGRLEVDHIKPVRTHPELSYGCRAARALEHQRRPNRIPPPEDQAFRRHPDQRSPA